MENEREAREVVRQTVPALRDEFGEWKSERKAILCRSRNASLDSSVVGHITCDDSRGHSIEFCTNLFSSLVRSSTDHMVVLSTRCFSSCR